MGLLSKEQAFRTRNIVILAGVASTLTVWNTLFDPINLPKMFVLAVFAAWILGTVIVSGISARPVALPLGVWAVIAFGAGILIAASLTDVSYTGFFGTLQRNDGAITYLSLAVMASAAMLSFTLDGLQKLQIGLLSLGSILTFHGLLQISGHDPFKWVLLYNPVVGTTGNPDFMSAAVSACAIASVWVLVTRTNSWVRGGSAILLLGELFVVKRTGSIQGLIAFAVGCALILLTKLWQLNRRLGLTSTVILLVISIPGFLGFFGVGPLAGRLLRSSMKSRLDYWHAAIGMFKAHPLLGVGLDRFGENYGKFAPQVQVVHGQITNNAHDVFLQLLATGGLLVFVPYLLLLGVIFYSAVKAIRIGQASSQLHLVSLFAIWFSLLLISIISIDNLSVTVWFWISGGALYAVSQEIQRPKEPAKASSPRVRKKNQPEAATTAALLAPITSLILTLAVIVLLVPILKTSSAIMSMQGNRDQLSPVLYRQKLNDIGNSWPRNPQVSFLLSDLGLRIQRPDLALKFADETIAMDPKSNFGRQLAAAALESEKKFGAAIPYRIQLMELDPWNTASMIYLIKDYVGNNQLAQARSIAAKISTLYPGSDDAKSAMILAKG